MYVQKLETTVIFLFSFITFVTTFDDVLTNHNHHLLVALAAIPSFLQAWLVYRLHEMYPPEAKHSVFAQTFCMMRDTIATSFDLMMDVIKGVTSSIASTIYMGVNSLV